MGRLITLATCSLNQWVLDWRGNAERIIESIRVAKKAGATLRVGPELEYGYVCPGKLDPTKGAQLADIARLAYIIDHEDCQDIVCDVGIPIRSRNIRYNARVIFYNRKIILIRPKQYLANDGNYREMRYFTPWTKERTVEDYYLEDAVRKVTGQYKVPFGDAIISTFDTAFSAETCEELFTPNAPHIHQGLDGCEIFLNASGSHHELRKAHTRLNLIVEATRLSKGVYLYANQQGCDGDRLYSIQKNSERCVLKFRVTVLEITDLTSDIDDGCAMIVVNGKVVAQGSQFSLNDVEVVTATVDIEEVRAARAAPSRGMQAQMQPVYPRIDLNVSLSEPKHGPSPTDLGPSSQIQIKTHPPPEEIAYSPALWLWDYLRRCRGVAGYFIPLSGGIDSCATSVIVFSMCRLVHAAIHSADTQHNTKAQVIKDCRRLCGEPEDTEWLPSSPQEICGRIFHTCFMGTTNSSADTRRRAKELAKDIGAYHIDMDIDTLVSALTTLFTKVTGFVMRFKTSGGAVSESVALQNLQARLRMVVAYLFAQMLPTVRKRRGGGGLLVLGSANVDEQLRGYLTKYDCSAADVNPIGGISKTDLKSFIDYASTAFDLPILQEFLDATPTAELEPITENYVQSDEVDMGMTYAELSVFGRLRKVNKLGPWGMYERLVHAWSKPPPATDRPSDDPGLAKAATHETAEAAHVIHGRGLSPREVYDKVRRFFYYFNINRHKQTIMTPSLHLEEYSPDDNRFDLRPFLYPPMAGSWPVQKIEEHVQMLEEKQGKADR